LTDERILGYVAKTWYAFHNNDTNADPGRPSRLMKDILCLNGS